MSEVVAGLDLGHASSGVCLAGCMFQRHTALGAEPFSLPTIKLQTTAHIYMSFLGCTMFSGPFCSLQLQRAAIVAQRGQTCRESRRYADKPVNMPKQEKVVFAPEMLETLLKGLLPSRGGGLASEESGLVSLHCQLVV